MELPVNEVHLYFSRPEQISDPTLLGRYESLLTDDERTQMSRLYFARHRQQYLITRALIRSTLSSYFPVEPVDWRFGKNGYGKPEIDHPDTSWAVRFNLSHCDGLILSIVFQVIFQRLKSPNLHNCHPKSKNRGFLTTGRSRNRT